jgi:hypothetical protein
MKTLVAAVVLLVGSVAVPAVAAEKIPVFVTSAGAGTTLTDSNANNRDAVIDLEALVDDQSDLKTVTRRDNAKIVLVVESCEYVSTPGSPTPQSRIKAKFVVGQTESLLEGTADIRVRGIDQEMLRAVAARSIARQVNAWVQQNRAKVD